MADPSIKLLNGYSNDFNDPTKCAGIADDQIAHGADILFQARRRLRQRRVDRSWEEERL